MYVNIVKCYRIKFPRKKKIFHMYYIDQQQFIELTQIREIGDILDSHLTFGSHIITHDLANKSLRFIMIPSKSLKNS